MRLPSALRAVMALCLCLLAAGAPETEAVEPDRGKIAAILDGAGIKPKDGRRGQMDITGYASTAAQMDAVLAQCTELAAPHAAELMKRYGWDDSTRFIAGVCPHDDYYYSGRHYSLLLSRIAARHVIIFGVFHKARLFGCRDKLVFDDYTAWHGPYGPIPVSPARDDIISRLQPAEYVIDNDMQMVEHSVEGIATFLQAYNREVEIVSILVPSMAWERMDQLAASLSDAVGAVIAEHGWKLGEDIAFICSADAVHYGDAEWGGQNYAEFGCTVKGYREAITRDMALAHGYLAGPLAPDKLRAFLYQCVDEEDITRYTVTWCGRFSIPFGLRVASLLVDRTGREPLTGTVLDYGTSVSEVSLDLDTIPGLGVTAPNNLHHFVGYASIGYTSQ